MRYVNEDLETIEKPDILDPKEYEVWEQIIIKPDAVPPDNETKHAYLDEDYETVTVIRKISKVEKIRKAIDGYKSYLFNTDYVPIKLMEGVTTAEEYANVLEQRGFCRSEINRLEEELNGLVSSD